MKRKLIKRLLLTVIMTVLCMAVGMTAEAEWCGDFNYKLVDGEAHIISNYDGGYITTLEIPETLDGYPVVSISNLHFSTATKVIIPETVVTIKNHAFYYCPNLTEAVIPDSVISIGSYAFSNCTKLADFEIPDSVTDMGYDAFSNTAFYNNEDNWENGVLYSGSFLLNVKEDIISATVKEGTKCIAQFAFLNCKNLKSVNLPDSLVHINKGAFQYCTSLESLIIPANVKTIADEVFSFCIKLETLYADPANEYFSTDGTGVLFNKDKTELIRFPSSCNLTSYTIPDSVKVISQEAFSASLYLENITIPEGVTHIEPYAFYGCSVIRNLHLPDSITTIEESAFVECVSLRSISLPKNLTEIPDSCFSFCFNLRSITIPEKLRWIGDSAFDGCFTLKDMYIMSSDIEFSPYLYIGYIAVDESKLTVDELTRMYISYAKSAFTEVDDFEDVIFSVIYQTEKPITTLHFHEGSNAEAYAIEKNMDYEYTHFFEDEWHDGDESACRYRNCIFCDAKETVEHNMGEFVIIKEPTCTENGEERADCANCDYYKFIEIPKAGHVDENHDGYCDICNEYIADKNCSCICHTTGLWGLLYKIIYTLDKILEVDLLEKVFNIGQFCNCSIAHY